MIKTMKVNKCLEAEQHGIRLWILTTYYILTHI